MTRMFVTMLVVLGIFGSPVLRELCLVRCASTSAHDAAHQADSGMGAMAHSCHDAATSSAAAIGAAPHGCEHDGPDPLATTAILAADHRCATPAVSAIPVAIAAPAVSAVRRPAWASGPDPGRPPLRPVGALVPLRI